MSAEPPADFFAEPGAGDDGVLVDGAVAHPYSAFRASQQASRAPMIADVVATLAKSEAVVRLPTGISTLDECMRGGLPSRRLVVIGGAPGSGKTSVATRLAYQWAQSGIHVGMLCVDEGPEGFVERAALYEGCKPDLLEAGDTSEWARLATSVQDLPLILDAGDSTIESLAAQVRAAAGDKTAVLIVDSIQTARAETEVTSDRRLEIDRVVRALKIVRDQHKLLVIATCEIARAFYRSRDAAAQLNPLAAFKESGSIEYAAQTALVLTTPKGQHDVIDVAVPKNRGYRKAPFRLSLHSDLSFHETELPPEDEQDGPGPGPRTATAHVDRDAHTVRQLLLTRPGIAGSHALRAEIQAQGDGISKDRVQAAIAKLGVREQGGEDMGQQIINRGTRNRPAWYLRSTSTAASAGQS